MKSLPDKLLAKPVRIPFPERVPINRAVLFAVALFVIQKLEGTPLYFCAGCMVFLLVAAFAFNAAGGLSRASGAYIFAYCMLVVIVGLCYKAYLGEPAQSNLLDPRTDIEAYIGSVAGMYAAVVVSRRFTRKTGLLQNILEESKMHRASVGCILLGIGGAFALAALGESAVRLQSAFNQLNQLIPLGIIIGVMYEIRRSGGTRCTNTFILIGAAYYFFFAVVFFSKQGMILPFYCWALPICAQRYRLSIVQLFGGLLAISILFYWLVPFSQYGRGTVPEGGATFTQRIELATSLLEHPNRTRRAYLEDQENQAYAGPGSLGSYYNKPQGFWDRLQFISEDDALINYTDQGHVFGLVPIQAAFLNVIPHFLWPNKPTLNIGNGYYHELNGEAQGEGDTTTGISFSPTGEAYHIAGWTGIFVLAPILWFMLFTIFDSLLGDIRSSAWGLLAMAMVSHAAPEGGITFIPYLCSFGIEILIFCAFFATWFAPSLATLVLGPERRAAPRNIPFRPRLRLP
jgi:hypothetical protein